MKGSRGKKGEIMLIVIYAGGYKQEVHKSGKLVLVHSCGPQFDSYLALSPKVDKLEETYGDKLQVAKKYDSKNKRSCLDLKGFGTIKISHLLGR